MKSVLVDLHLAVRGMAAQPTATGLIIATLALGLAATGVAVSFAKSILFDPLPYPAADRLVMLWQDFTAHQGPEREWFSYPTFLDYRGQVGALAEAAAFGRWQPTVGGSSPQAVAGGAVSHSFFTVLGRGPVEGRGFSAADDRPGAPPVVLLRRDLARRLGVPVDGTIVLDGIERQVIGLLPEDLRFAPLPEAQVWMPLGLDREESSRGNISLRVVGRLAPEVRIEEAQAQVSALAERLAQEHPEAQRDVGGRVEDLAEFLGGPNRPALLVLLATALGLLLVALVNATHLLLARGLARRRHLAVRSALGAGRGRLVRELLTESVLLATTGGLLGLLLASFGVDLLRALVPAQLAVPRLDEVELDLGAVGITGLATLVAGVLAGLVPAALTTRIELDRTLRDGERGGTERAGSRVSRALVALETALALVLLSSAGFLLAGFLRLTAVEPGFRVDGLATFSLSAPGRLYPEAGHLVDFYDRLLGRLAALPGVRAAVAASSLPLSGADSDISFTIAGQPEPATGDEPVTWYRQVTPGYLETLGIPLLEGRRLGPGDDREAPPVAVVNESFVRRYLADRPPLGQVLQGPRDVTIVGVVGDVRSFGLHREEPPVMYLSFAQFPSRFMSVAIRTGEAAPEVLEAARRVLAEVDPRLVPLAPASLAQRFADSVAPERATVCLVGGIGLAALLLAAVGLYGVVSYGTRRRVREIGIRMALGARTGDVLSLVLREGLVPVLAGAVAGSAGAFAAARLLRGSFYGLEGLDPLVLTANVGLLAAAALAALWQPARRAARTDPARVLSA